MSNFSTDSDLLKWEPTLFRDLAVPGQRLASGTDGETAGLAFSSDSADFVAAGVAPGHVVRLIDDDGQAAGCWQVLSVESPTLLLATQVGRLAGDSVNLPTGSHWAWTIDTFDPQAEEARFELLARLGLAVDEDGADLANLVLQPRSLRRASVFATLTMIFEGASGAAQEGRNLAAKAALYRRLYDKELTQLRVRLDRDGDGLADDACSPGTIRLERA